MAGLGLIGVIALAAGTVCLTSGCSTLGYYAQSVGGHLSMLQAAKPVPDWLADSTTPPALRERLVLTQQMRDYAITELHLPDNPSYRRYADLHRSAVVWNVVAAPELSLQLKTWCFPVMGCVGYRGYFSQPPADALADTLKGEGYETSVYGVPAYSTLGWGNWLGGDPLLNTFVNWPEGDLARLIFHELAHQVAYASNDTMFNESFATAVERLGSARWLEQRGGAAAREEYQKIETRRNDFRTLTMGAREALDTLYRSSASDADKRSGKAQLMQKMRQDYALMKAERWAGYSGYDGWFTRANNATLGVQAAYNQLVPQFERLFEREGRDFPRFYAAVQRLAALPRDERRATLEKD